MERYARQIRMEAIGEAGQKKLLASSVLVIGCGGLGSTLLYCLAGMGVGRIGILDDDTVSLSNLNRQFLHTVKDLGREKTVSGLDKLSALNPDIRIDPYQTRLTRENAEGLLAPYDLIVTATDNLSSRLIANRVCVNTGKVLVNGGVEGFFGTVQIVEPGNGPCLACVYGEGDREPDACHASVAPPVSIVSAMMADCALLLLLGRENPLKNEMLYMDLQHFTFHRIPFLRRADCSVCGDKLGA